MKAVNTINKQMRELREFIESADSRDAVDEAYAYETALIWVKSNCAWTPMGLAKATKDRLEDGQGKQ